MNRPENVHCGNCVFWEVNTAKSPTVGLCHGGVPQRDQYGDGHFPEMYADEWCGEFRETWPETRERVPTLPGEIAPCPLCEEPVPIGHAHRCRRLRATPRRSLLVVDPEVAGGYRIVEE